MQWLFLKGVRYQDELVSMTGCSATGSFEMIRYKMSREVQVWDGKIWYGQCIVSGLWADSDQEGEEYDSRRSIMLGTWLLFPFHWVPLYKSHYAEHLILSQSPPELQVFPVTCILRHSATQDSVYLLSDLISYPCPYPQCPLEFIVSLLQLSIFLSSALSVAFWYLAIH